MFTEVFGRDARSSLSDIPQSRLLRESSSKSPEKWNQAEECMFCSRQEHYVAKALSHNIHHAKERSRTTTENSSPLTTEDSSTQSPGENMPSILPLVETEGAVDERTTSFANFLEGPKELVMAIGLRPRAN